MNDLVRFATSVEYTTGKKRGRHPVFNSNMFYPYKEERRLQQATRNELESFVGAAFGAAVAGESFVSDSLDDLSNLPEELSEDMKREISYAAGSIARKASQNIVNMTEMVVGKPYFPPSAKQEILDNWQSNFAMLCKSAKSDVKKDISMLVQQARNEGWNLKQLEREVKDRLPSKYAGRAQNIARTETGKLETSVTLSTYREIGVEYYVWMSAMDERTRPEHAMMNGLICSVNDPTVWYEENPDDPMHPIMHKRDDTMVKLHPGEDFQCRCVMVAWDPMIDGKYEVKERPEEEEPEQKPENEPESRELEKANERLAEQEKELERAEKERKTVEKELSQEKNAKEAAEKAQKEAEASIKKEAEKSISAAERGLESAKRYEGITNDPGLKKCVAEVEESVRETKKSGIASALYEKLGALKERIFGIQSEEDAMEAIGAKRFEKKKTPLQVVDGTNPTKNEKNCFACAAVYEMRCRGWNIEAASFDESMIVLSNEPQRLFRNAQKIEFSSKKDLLERISLFEDGSRFSVCSLLQDNKGALFFHVFSVIIENRRAYVVCSQNGIVGTEKFFRRFTPVGEGNFFFRVDNLKANYRNLSKIIQK